MNERNYLVSEELKQKFLEKSQMVSKGIMTLIWAHTNFYIFPHIEDDLKEYGVYINSHGRFAVQLDDGSEYILIQPCPWLICDLYEAKSIIDTYDHCSKEVIRKAEAYDKFHDFFEFMIYYANRKFNY